MSKHVIRIPARRAGRRVCWTLEVSADVGEGDIVRAKKTSTNRTSTKAPRKATTTSAPRPRTRRAPAAAVVPAAPETGTVSEALATAPAISAPVVAPAVAAPEIVPAVFAPAIAPAAPAIASAPSADPKGASAVRPTSSPPMRAPVASQTPPRVWRATSAGTLLVIVVAGFVIAAVARPRFPAAGVVNSPVTVKQPEVQVNAPQPATAALSNVLLPVATIPAPVRADDLVAANPVPQAKAERSITGKATRASTGKAITTSAVEPPIDPVLPVAGIPDAGETAGVLASTATTSTSVVATTSATASTPALASVSLTGCLEVSVDEERFRLTDAQGTNVPKARSWRSGFLAKRSAPVALLEIADPLAVRKYVGQRVVATGVVENREMRVQSLEASGGRCNP